MQGVRETEAQLLLRNDHTEVSTKQQSLSSVCYPLPCSSGESAFDFFFFSTDFTLFFIKCLT